MFTGDHDKMKVLTFDSEAIEVGSQIHFPALLHSTAAIEEP